MVLLNTIRFPVLAISLQVVFIVLFGIFVRYPDLALPTGTHDHHGNETAHDAEEEGDHEKHGIESKAEVGQYYAFFQDIHVMMFIGFGFLMTFLKRYGFSSVGLNLLVAALVLQWATLTGGWILHFEHNVIHVGITDLISADFAAAAVLISFGAVLGKVNASQLLIMALIEIVLFQVNEKIVFYYLQASDTGDSMVVHIFGAYFGLAVARVIYTDDAHKAEPKESSVYHSDLFAMIGTVFLWMFWPSFNSATAVGEGQYRAVINTYFALAACAVVAFAISALLQKGKFNMVHIQNATLAGGVAIGTMADMIVHPFGALIVGSIAAVISVAGYRFLTPFLSHRFNFHDTCGVHNLHGMPGILSALGGIVCASFATVEIYGKALSDQFPARADESVTAGDQAGRQAAALGVSLGIAIVGGLLTGLVLRIPIWDQPSGERVFDDLTYWDVPEDGFPGVVVTHNGDHHKNQAEEIPLKA